MLTAKAPEPLATKGTQEPGHEGEATVREETPEYTKPLETKGTQELGHEGEAAAQPELPEYKVSEEKKAHKNRVMKVKRQCNRSCQSTQIQ